MRRFREQPSAVFFLYLLFSCIYFKDALIGGLLLAPGDGSHFTFPIRRIAAAVSADSPLQLWNPYLFSGYPLLASIPSAVYYPPNWISLFLNTSVYYPASVIIHYAFSAFFTYLLARLYGASAFPAFLAGVLFGFSGYVAAHLQHKTIIDAAIYLPLLLFYYEKLRRTLDFKYTLFASLAVSLQVLAGHPQTSFQSCLVLVFFIIYNVRNVKAGNRIRFAVYGFLPFAVGALISLPQLLATAELSTLSPRASYSPREFTSFSFPPHMLPSLISPFLWGRGYGGKYWGPLTDTTQTEGFMGTFPIILALFAFIGHFRKTPAVRLLGIVGIAGALLSFGRYLPFYDFLFNVPLYNLFRAPSRHWLEVNLAASLLFSIGLTALFSKEGSRLLKWGAIAALSGVSAAALLSVTLLKEGLYGCITATLNIMSPQLMRQALSLQSPAIYLPVVFMSSYVLWLLFFKSRPFIKYLLMIIVFAEVFSFGSGFIGGPVKKDFDGKCESGLIGFLKDKKDGRIAFIHDRLQPLHGAMCGLRMTDGYEQLVIARYNSLLDLDTRGVYNQWQGILESNNALSMLNAKYIVVSPRMDGFVSGVKKHDSPAYEKLYSSDEGAVYSNRLSLPLAYTVSRIVPSENDEQTKKLLYGTGFDADHEALLAPEDLEKTGGPSFAEGAIEVISYKSGEVLLRVASEGPAFLVLSEQFYPGWRAYVDGRQTTVFRTNTVLQGITVPAGLHNVRFAYKPYRIYAAVATSIITLLIVLYLSIRRNCPPFSSLIGSK